MTPSEVQQASRRAHDRRELRTAATVVLRNSAGLQSLKCWTDDLSLSGARLQSLTEIQAADIYVRILMEGLSEQVLTARVVRCDLTSHWFDKKEVTRFVYGIEFQGICVDPAVRQLAGCG
ncbi:MAG: PilZ domain-containing protein [Planctomycetales bacterium]|nr:PilZ domain-containing protein [Planctomycetales bacterium]